MQTLDWAQCPLVEVIPGKVSGAPLLTNTRLPVEAITGNYDAFRDEGLSPDAAIAETLDCYPEAGIETIPAILAYRGCCMMCPSAKRPKLIWTEGGRCFPMVIARKINVLPAESRQMSKITRCRMLALTAQVIKLSQFWGPLHPFPFTS